MIHKSIEIVGGGLAGLSLGLALRKEGIPVTLYEAADYPRHRVCGEFIAGLSASLQLSLGLEPFVADAVKLRTVGWILRERLIRTQTLPQPALGISRYTLDARLAGAFSAAGGDLQKKCRVGPSSIPGRVWAAGRRISHSDWIGLKLHVSNLATLQDLEVHLGEHAYVGLSRVESEAVNVCGLFRRRSELGGPPSPVSRPSYFLNYLEACGLSLLAKRLRHSEIDAHSFCAIAGLDFQQMKLRPDRIEIGDALALIPPFTGNGMTIAFQSARLAVEPILSYARNQLSWSEACQQTAGLFHRHFRTRLLSANFLHPFIYQPRRQRWLLAASRSGFLPVDSLYHLTH